MPAATPTWAQIFLYPPLVALSLWLVLTIGLLWLNRRGQRVGRIALLLTLGPLVLIHWQLHAVRFDLGIGGAYTAFICGLLIWTWHELGFYSGVLAGPWQSPCPTGVRGTRRFVYALNTHLYHELAVGAEVLLLWWLHRDATNVVGPLTFVFLWALQHSAKLNVFLGVRTLQVQLLPDHLRYLGSFWQRRPGNAFFLPAVSLITLLAFWLWGLAGMQTRTGPAVGITFLAMLMTLGVGEHWLLMLPGKSTTTQPARPPAVKPGLKPDRQAAGD